jgi:hypothetical protein
MSGEQFGLTDDELTTAKTQTNREKFRSGMEAVVLAQGAGDRSGAD